MQYKTQTAKQQKKTKCGFDSGVRTGAALWIMRGCEHGYDD